MVESALLPGDTPGNKTEDNRRGKARSLAQTINKKGSERGVCNQIARKKQGKSKDPVQLEAGAALREKKNCQFVWHI